VPPNTDGDDEALEFEQEQEDSAIDEFVNTTGIQHQSIATKLTDLAATPILSASYPDRTVFNQGLHRTDSHASAQSHDLPANIDSPSDITPPLPPIHEILGNQSNSQSNARNQTLAKVTQGPCSSIHQSSSRESDVTFGNDSLRSDNIPVADLSCLNFSPPLDINISPFSSTAFSPNTSIKLRWPVCNAWEARLLHHFIVHCTLWIDVCDSKCHFGKEVPRRAAQFPVILNGILGLASRHLWLLGKIVEDHSQSYIDSCLQALIVALEDPLAHWDENFLVAVSA
jgi:hypothetical protein